MSEVFAAHGVTIKKSSYDHLQRIGRHLGVTLSCRLCRPKRCGLPRAGEPSGSVYDGTLRRWSVLSLDIHYCCRYAILFFPSGNRTEISYVLLLRIVVNCR